MAVIYLRHPVHGQKVACGVAEAQYDQGHGWEIFDPNEKVAPAALVVDPVPVEVPAFLAPSPEPVTPEPPRVKPPKLPKI